MHFPTRRILSFSLFFLILLSGLSQSYHGNSPRYSSGQSGGYSNVVGPVSFTVAGASFIENSPAGANAFILKADPGASISISGSASANPLCCDASYGGVSSDLNISLVDNNNVGTSSYVNGSGLGMSTTASFTASNAAQQISGAIQFDTYCGSLRGCPDSWQSQFISLTIVLQPTVSLFDNLSTGALAIPGTVALSGFVLPNSMSVTLNVYQNGIFSYSLSASPDSNGMYTTGLALSSPDQVGAYTVTAVASNTYDYSSGGELNATASVNFTVYGGADSTSSAAASTSTYQEYTSSSPAGATTYDATTNYDATATTPVFSQSASETTTTTDNTSRLPVIFIPGIGGSSLLDASTGAPVWPCPDAGLTGCVGSYLTTKASAWSPMMLGSDGSSYGAGVVPGDILQSGMATNFYGGFISYLQTFGYVSNYNLYVFPYDWRQDVTAQFSSLDLLVQRALDTTGADKVVLIGHSMGGLIATGYVQSSPSRASLIDTIISIGTPYFGAPKAYYALTAGYDFDNAIISPDIMKVIAQNSPGAYDLLPRVSFILDNANNAWLNFQQATSITYPGIMSNTENPATPLDAVESANLISSPGFPIRTPIPTWTFNPAILSEIQLLGNLIGPKDHPTPLPAGIKQYVIIGTGIQTLDSYTMNNAYGWQKYFLFDNRHVILVPNFQDGDGTVPLRMAEISTATATYFVPYQKDYVFGGGSTSHGKLTDNDKVKQIVASILGGSPEDQSTFGYTSQALVNLDKKVDFTLHSNAQLSIVDSATGNTLGYTSTGGIREDLGSGTFIDQDGIEYASIQNNSDPLAVLVNGTSTGNFTLTVNYTTSGGIMAFSYPDVQVQQGTNSQLSFNPSAISLADRSSVPDLRVNKLGSVTQVAPTIVAIDAFSTTAAGNYTTGSNSGLVLGAIAVITTVTVAGTALAVVKRKKKEK